MSEEKQPSVEPTVEQQMQAAIEKDPRISVSKRNWDGMKEALLECYGYLDRLYDYRRRPDQMIEILKNIGAAREGRKLPHQWPSSICIPPYPKDYGLIDDLLAMIEDRIDQHRCDWDHESTQD